MPRKAPDLICTEPSRPAAASSFDGQRIYLIGIGGCGMSGLARLVRAAAGGRERGGIEGSDCVPNDFTASLQQDGVLVHENQIASNLSRDCDLVIATAAIGDDHPEMAAARSLGIPVMQYAEALGLLQSEHTGVSIAGTHGKSTTAAILSHILIQCGLDPSLVVGANCPQIGGNARVGAALVPKGPHAGRPGLFLAEACEFNRSFHHHHPVIALINNIEADHLDIYGSLDNLVDAFATFAQRIAPQGQGGRLLIRHENAHREAIVSAAEAEVFTFGCSHDAHYRIEFEEQTCVLFEDSHACARWKCPMPGEHNAWNAVAAAIIAHWCGCEWEEISRAIESFQGVDRRMQVLGERLLESGSVIVYDDYGHHPTEIRATLRAIREYEQPGRLICVFQPHQHSRTRHLLRDFGESFADADVVIVPHIYFVRDGEEEKGRVSARDLVDEIQRNGVRAMHVYPFAAVVDMLESVCAAGDVIVNMGAGPVWQIAHEFMRRGRKPPRS